MNSPAMMRRGKEELLLFFMKRGDCSEDCFEDFIDIGVDPDPELFGHLGSVSETESDPFDLQVCVIWADFAVLPSCGSVSP